MLRLRRFPSALVAGVVLAMALPVGAADVDKYLPDDTEIVVVVNAKQILDSRVVKKHLLKDLREFIDKGFTALHDVVEFWDSPSLKIFHGKVTMKFDDPSLNTVRPTMTHFFYMDNADPPRVSRWVGSVGPTGF